LTLSVVSCPLFPSTTSFVAAGDSCNIHSSSPLPAADQVYGAGYSKCEVETDMATLQVETSAAALELEMDATDLELETSASSL
jgi:hypothetical protein